MITEPRRNVGDDLEDRRVERLADKLMPELRARGQLLVRTEDLDDVDRWRRAVRRAARLLGWHVRTGVSGAVAWGVVEDWPSNSADTETLNLGTRAILDVAPRHGPPVRPRRS